MSNFNLPNIEDRSTPLGAALGECEVFCVAVCCGMDAFHVTVEHLQLWADRVPAADLERARRDVDEALVALKDAPETFYFLDCNHTRRDVTEWFESIQRTFAAVNPGKQR